MIIYLYGRKFFVVGKCRTRGTYHRRATRGVTIDACRFNRQGIPRGWWSSMMSLRHWTGFPQDRNQDFPFENRAYSPNDSSADTDRQFDKSTDYEPLLPFVAAAHYTATSQQFSSTRLKATRGWLRRKQHDSFYSVDTSGYLPIFFRLTQSSEVPIVFSRSRIR